MLYLLKETGSTWIKEKKEVGSAWIKNAIEADLKLNNASKIRQFLETVKIALNESTLGRLTIVCRGAQGVFFQMFE